MRFIVHIGSNGRPSYPCAERRLGIVLVFINLEDDAQEKEYRLPLSGVKFSKLLRRMQDNGVENHVLVYC